MKYFDVVVTSAGFGKRKPNPAIFIHLLKELNLEKEANECFICGDEHADIVGGYKAELRTILCERIYNFPFEKEIDVPNIIRIKNISEIVDIIS